jgi:hypothetical protein
MVNKIKAQGTIKTKKKDNRNHVIEYLSRNNDPPLDDYQQRERIVRFLLDGITATRSGGSISTFFIRGLPEEKKALTELANWLRSDDPPPNYILKRLGDLIDPDLRSYEPQRFQLVYRTKGVGKDHKAQTNTSVKLTQLIVDTYVASETKEEDSPEIIAKIKERAFEEVAKISNVDPRYVKNVYEGKILKKKV